MTDWHNRIIGHGEENPEDLLAHPENWRVHPKAQQYSLSTVLDGIGLVQSVVVNQRSGFVVDGHLRISLALRSGQKTIPVTYVDLTDDEERIVLATLDPIGAMAVPDREQLCELIASVECEDSELVRLLAQIAAAEEVPDVHECAPARTVMCPECGHMFDPSTS